jgi:phospholipase/carboxylesterase
MTDAVVDDIVALLPPLLHALETLEFVARHFDPPQFGAVMQQIGTPEQALPVLSMRLTDWPDQFAHLRGPLHTASEAALAAFAGLRAVEAGDGDLVAVFRALRHLPRAQEALYALAAVLPPVSDYFLDPARRDDADWRTRLAQPANPEAGIFHDAQPPGGRGGFSLYVPEYAPPARGWPLVMALHGGSGNGRGFLWSWLRDARSFGALVVAPTAIGPTWALMGEDADTPNLARILQRVRDRWPIDPTRMLLTGMSDGGTFCYVSGLESGSLFTHLAPVSATFHPLMAQIADGERLRGLPIHIVHGRRDWMFPVEVARQASEALSMAGAEVRYREIDDLSHCYPREINAVLLDWLCGETAL